MTERQQQPIWSGEPAAPPDFLPEQLADGPPDLTVSGIPLQRVVVDDEPTLFGLPAEVGDDDSGTDGSGTADDVVPIRLVSIRRADPVAGVLLVLAGAAAAASLWLPWLKGDTGTGLPLVRRGLEIAGSDIRTLGPSGLWQPLAIVLGGVVLFLLGVLMFGPARTHRLSGVLALLVASAAAAGVLFRIGDAGWDVHRWDLGLWCAVAVAGLGLLGALKAMLTAPRITPRWRRTAQE
jgi:hypothetical protein